ncbi:putative organic solvent tolerance protein [Bdellovibrio bacteriovorus W]|nr:putative organic solvent tolerance protein [Bdellovibrio bacteriovorus W]
MTKFLASCFVVMGLLIGTSVQAKELSNRLGVGVKKNATLDLPELAMVYHFAPDLSVAAGLGIDTEKDQSKFTFNAGVRRIVFKEENMNFYMGGSLGLANFETSGDKQSGFELNALFGAEFFLPGLDSLAFTFEGGVGILSADNVRFRTIAGGPFNAGIIFYF